MLGELVLTTAVDVLLWYASSALLQTHRTLVFSVWKCEMIPNFGHSLSFMDCFLALGHRAYSILNIVCVSAITLRVEIDRDFASTIFCNRIIRVTWGIVSALPGCHLTEGNKGKEEVHSKIIWLHPGHVSNRCSIQPLSVIRSIPKTLTILQTLSHFLHHLLVHESLFKSWPCHLRYLIC